MTADLVDVQDVRIERGVVYGHGLVGAGGPGPATPRPLRLDAYLPAEPARALRAAVVLAFGGAFHRGSREDDVVSEGGRSNTSIAAYCRWLATRGYAAFSIDYRLVTEDPDPGTTRVVADPQAIPRARVDHVRQVLGLAPASVQTLWQGIEAASDDVAAAFRFVQAEARRWNVDPGRIALGGFSAGARSAWNAAYGEGVPARALILLSGYMDLDDLSRHLAGGRPLPPILLVRGERDLDYVCAQNASAATLCRAQGIACSELVVEGAGHFYPAHARGRDERGEASSVEEAIESLLAHTLAEPSMKDRGRHPDEDVAGERVGNTCRSPCSRSGAARGASRAPGRPAGRWRSRGR